MALKSKQILHVLGYDIDGQGNVKHGVNQMAIVSLENDLAGAVLRVHGSDDQFFYSGDILLEEKDLMFPSKITAKYVYFRGRSDTVRVEDKEFMDNTMRALAEFNKLSSKKLAG